MQIKVTERVAPTKSSSVVVSVNPKRESETLDKAGNVINPRTKQIIRKFEP